MPMDKTNSPGPVEAGYPQARLRLASDRGLTEQPCTRRELPAAPQTKRLRPARRLPVRPPPPPLPPSRAIRAKPSKYRSRSTLVPTSPTLPQLLQAHRAQIGSTSASDAFDTTRHLIALQRAAGISARFVFGRVVPAG